MKALDEYFPVLVFTLLLSRLHVWAIFMFNLDRNMAVKGLKHNFIKQTCQEGSFVFEHTIRRGAYYTDVLGVEVALGILTRGMFLGLVPSWNSL